MLTLRSKGSDYHHGDLHTSAIAAGRDFVAKGGVHAIGIRKVAEKIGVTPTALYRHFEDLNAFQNAISLSIRDDLGDFMESESQSIKNPKKRLVALGGAYIDFAAKNPRLFEMAFLWCESSEAPEPQGKAWELLQSSIQQLDVRRATGLDLALWSLVHGFATLVAQGTIRKSEFQPQRNLILNTSKKLADAYLA